MPRVLRIINRFNLGGITYNVSYLSRYMSTDFETRLIGGPAEDGEESSLFIPRSMNLEPETIWELKRSINPFADYMAYRKIKSIIRQFKPDIVHTHASKAGAIGRLAAFHCNVPVVIHTFHGHVFHGYFGKFKTEIFKKIERYLATRSSAIVAISDTQKNELCGKYKICDPGKTRVIALGFDLNKFAEHQEKKRKEFRNKYLLNDSDIAIVIIGRLAPIKNHYLFLDAIAFIKNKTGKTIRAFIVGDGETKSQLLGYAEKLSLSVSEKPDANADIVFTSWIREVDYPLAGCDLVCLTSKNEGTPVSLIEAQAASKFIISTNVGGIKDILHPDCGLLSEVNDPEGFTKNLLYAVNHLDKVNQQAGAAKQDVLARFGYMRLCHDMEELYHEQLKQKNY